MTFRELRKKIDDAGYSHINLSTRYRHKIRTVCASLDGRHRAVALASGGDFAASVPLIEGLCADLSA